MLIQKLTERGVIHPPKWLPDNCQYVTIMGSMAYGVNRDESDLDIYGFAIPPKEVVFPHTAGIIKGFGDQGTEFGQWQEHHVKNPDGVEQEYDFTVYNIVKYFDLIMANNPNMVDSLFTPDNCVLYKTRVGEMVREKRRSFLHKGAWHKYKGYAYAQMGRYRGENEGQKVGAAKKFMSDHNILNEAIYDNLAWEMKMRRPAEPLLVFPNAKNWTISETEPENDVGLTTLSNDELVTYYNMIHNLTDRQVKTLEVGTDTKAMYHIIRLLNEVEQILTEGDLDLLRNREQLKSIRRGEWSVEEIERYFVDKEKALEQVYQDSKLPYSADEGEIKTLLIQCLEEHYGSLDTVVRKVDVQVESLLKDMQAVINRYV